MQWALLWGSLGLLTIWLILGFFIPFDFQTQACLEDLRSGNAPQSLWAWHPWLFYRAQSERSELLDEASKAASLSSSPAQLEAVAPRLAWACPFRPSRFLVSIL